MKALGRGLVLAGALSALLILGMSCRQERPDGSLKTEAAAPVPAEPAPVLTNAEPEPAAAVSWPLELPEARMAALALALENEELRRQVQNLRDQVGDMTLALAPLIAGQAAPVDRGAPEPAALPAGSLKKPGGEGIPVQLSLLDANERLRMVVLDAGAGRGIRTGMRFGVVRDGRGLARVRVVDVREQIAGAEVEQLMGKDFPRKGDKAVPVTSPEP